MKRLLQKTRVAFDELVACVGQAAETQDVSRQGDGPRTLEQRIMMSASPVPADVVAPEPADVSVAENEAFAATAAAATRESIATDDATESASVVVFLDEGVGTIEDHFDDEMIQRLRDQGVTVAQISSDTDGIAAISDFLATRSDVRKVHVLSHGNDGALVLGNQELSAATLAGHAGGIASWGNALDADAEIFIYGCDLASNEDGRTVIDSVAALTGATIAASDDLTGSQALGGDWDLEYTSGATKTNTAAASPSPSELPSDLGIAPSAEAIDSAADSAADSAISHFRSTFNGTLAVVDFQQGVNGYTGTVDTSIDDINNNVDQGSEPDLVVASGAGTSQSLLRFEDLFGINSGQIPFGSTINSVEITLQVNSTVGAPNQIALHEMLQTWDDSVTFDDLGNGVQQDDLESSSTAAASITGNSTTVTFSGGALENVVQNWANGFANNGFVLVQNAPTASVLSSSESSVVATRPKLTVDFTAPTPGTATEVWLTTEGNTNTSSNPGISGWEPDEIVSLGGANFSLGTSTSGTFALESDLSGLSGPSGQIRGLHYISRDISLDDTTSTVLDQGTLLTAWDTAFTVQSATGATVTFDENDVFVIRPSTPGDFSSGTISIVYNDVTTQGVESFTVVEQDTIVGGTTLFKGDLLFTESGSNSTDIMLFRPTDFGSSTTGTTTKLIDGDDLGIDEDIIALELIETATTIGGETFAAGELLLSTEDDFSAGGTTFRNNDMVAATIATTEISAASTTGSLRVALQGQDVSLNNDNESIAAFTVFQNNANTPPTATNLNQSIDFTSLDPEVPIRDIFVTDPDPNATIEATVTLSAPGSGAITAQSGNGESYNPVNGQWRVTGTLAEVNAALAAMEFVPNAANPASVTLDVSIQDQSLSGPTNGTITLNFINNAAPQLNVVNQVDTLANNTNTSGGVLIANLAIVDDLAGTNTLSLSGPDAALFEIVGGELRIVSGATLPVGDLNVTVTVDDATITSGVSGESQALTLTILDTVSPPTPGDDSFTVDEDAVHTSSPVSLLDNDTTPSTTTTPVPGAALTFDSTTMTPTLWDDVDGVPDFGWLISGTTTLSPDGPGEHTVPGIINSYVFDGTVAAPSQLSFGSPGTAAFGPMTVELWIKPSTLTGRQLVYEVGSATNGLTVVLDGSNVELNVNQNSNSQTLTTTGANLQVGRWTQIIAQVDPTGNLIGNGSTPGDLQIAIDGAVVASAAGTGVTSWTDSVNAALAGANSTAATASAANNYEGRVGLVRIYNQNLSNTDIIRNNNAVGNGLTITAVEGQSNFAGTPIQLASGATVTVAVDGTFEYNSNGVFNSLNAGQSIDDTFTYTTTNSLGVSATATVTATITGSFDAPVILTLNNNDVDEEVLGGAIGTVTTSGFGGTGVVTVTVDDNRFEVVGGELRLIATERLDHETETSVDIVLTAVDSVGTTVILNETITVNPINEAPVIQPVGDINVAEDPGTVNVDISDWFVDPESAGQWTGTVVSSGAAVETVSIDNSTKTLSLDFFKDVNGPSTVSVSATDSGGLVSTRTVDINIAPVQDAITRPNRVLQVPGNDALEGDVLINEVDTDGDQLTVELVDSPSSGTLTIDPDGRFRYVPAVGPQRIDSFTFITTDGVNQSDVTTVSLLVELQISPPDPDNGGGGDDTTDPGDGDGDDGGDGTDGTNEDLEGVVTTTPPDTTGGGTTDGLGLGVDAIGSTESESASGTDGTGPNGETLASRDAENAERSREALLAGMNAAAAEGAWNDGAADSLYATQAVLASMSQPGEIWEQLDLFKRSATAEFNFESITVGTVGTVSSSMIVGYVVWALRSGVLLSGVLTAMPAWNLLDPLAIVSFSDEESEGESLEDIVESGRRIPKTVTPSLA